MRQRSVRRRSGFTLVELLVVIAIIGILVALLLPAIQAAREAARRTECANNVKQLGLALQNYHDTFKVFPPAQMWFNRPNGQPTCGQDQGACSGEYGSSWLVQLLPFVEEQAVWEEFDPNFSMSANENKNVRSTFIDGFVCPSDAAGTKGNTMARYGGSWARSSYGANAGRLVAGAQLYKDLWRSLPSDKKGVMGNTGAANIAAIIDGTSNTISVWEIRAGVKPNDVRGTWALGRAVIVGGCDNQGDCQGINDQTGNPDDVHECDGDRGLRMPCWNGGDGQHGPKSLHPGGCHAGLADGKVQFISENIDLDRVMRALNSISGGESIPSY